MSKQANLPEVAGLKFRAWGFRNEKPTSRCHCAGQQQLPNLAFGLAGPFLGQMDPISAPLTALNLVIAICEIRKQIKANYADCSRLLARCEIFHPTLQQIQANPSIYRPTSEPAYQALVRNLEATVKFARKFQESTVYRTLVRAVSRNAYAQEIASLNLLLTESATDLGVTQSIDFEVRRREDMEVSPLLLLPPHCCPVPLGLLALTSSLCPLLQDAKACFQYCVDCMLEELSALGEQSADQFAQLQGDIEDNKAYLKTLLDLLEHRKLKPVEQLQVDEAMDGMKAQVLRCHAEVMATASQSVFNANTSVEADGLTAHKEAERRVAQKALEDARKEKELQAQKEAELQALRAAEQKALEDARKEKELQAQKEAEQMALRAAEQKELQARKQAEQKAFRADLIAQDDARKEMFARKDLGRQALRAAEQKALEDARKETALLAHQGAEQNAFRAELIAQDDARKELQLFARKGLGQQALRAAEQRALEDVRKETELEAQKETV